MTARQLLQQAIEQLQQLGNESPRLDAELILMHCAGLSHTGLIMRRDDELPEAVANQFQTLLQRRLQHEPLAYLTGEKEFWSREFHVDRRVLIPRPETEHLIEQVLQLFPDRQQAIRIADIGTGSGCIAITLACEYPHAQIIACDLSKDALAIAHTNAERHGVLSRIQLRQGDLYQALQAEDRLLDLIVSNPPYVAEHEMPGLRPDLLHEPRMALTDEQDGLSILRTLIHDGALYLRPGGYLVVETGTCGLPQERASGLKLVHDYRDLAGHLRGGVYSTHQSSESAPAN